MSDYKDVAPRDSERQQAIWRLAGGVAWLADEGKVGPQGEDLRRVDPEVVPHRVAMVSQMMLIELLERVGAHISDEHLRLADAEMQQRADEFNASWAQNAYGQHRKVAE